MSLYGKTFLLAVLSTLETFKTSTLRLPLDSKFYNSGNKRPSILRRSFFADIFDTLSQLSTVWTYHIDYFGRHKFTSRSIFVNPSLIPEHFQQHLISSEAFSLTTVSLEHILSCCPSSPHISALVFWSSIIRFPILSPCHFNCTSTYISVSISRWLFVSSLKHSRVNTLRGILYLFEGSPG